MLDTNLNKTCDIINIPNNEAATYPHITYNNNNLSFIWEDKYPMIWESQVRSIFYDTRSKEFSKIISYDDFSEYDIHPSYTFIDDTSGIATWTRAGDYIDQTITGQLSSINTGVINESVELNDHVSVIKTECSWSRSILLSDTSILVAWIDNHSGIDEIYGRLFNKDLAPLGSSFQISESVDSTIVWHLEIVKNSNDNIFIVWSEKMNKEVVVLGRCFDRYGNFLSDIITIDDKNVDSFTFIDVSINSIDQSIVVWEKNIYNKAKIFAQKFNANMNKNGKVYRISTNDIDDYEFYPKVIFETNERGTKVSSGIYFYKIFTNNYSQIKKMLLVQ